MNFIDLAFNPASRMNEVLRYSGVHQETNETLSDHITDVSMMCYIMAKFMSKEFREEFDIGSLLEKCLIHDIDEVITGDVPRNTKYATKKVHEELTIVASKATQLVEDSTGLSGLTRVWDTAKEGKEGLLLKVSDMLCVVKKAIMEVELRGNLSFLKVVKELKGHLKKMVESQDEWSARLDKESSREYVKMIVSQAFDEISKIYSKYYSVISTYHIKENVLEDD